MKLFTADTKYTGGFVLDIIHNISHGYRVNEATNQIDQNHGGLRDHL